jgi:hypothetical protein
MAGKLNNLGYGGISRPSSYEGLVQLYATHVVEVKVVRRNPKMGRGPTRRFLCTNSPILLNSIAGKSVFNFRAPTKRPPYNAKSYNLLTVYDLLMQDYRQVNLDTDVVLAGIPIRNEVELGEFWKVFEANIRRWSISNKQMFMNM